MLKRFVKRLLICLLLAALFVLVVIGGTLGVQVWGSWSQLAKPGRELISS